MASQLEPIAEQLVPISDWEIREMYHRALDAGFKPESSQPTIQAARLPREAEHSILTVAGGIALMVGLISGLSWGWSPGTVFGGLSFIGSVAYLVPRAYRGETILNFRFKPKVDPTSIEVLQVVTRYLADGPIKHAARLVDSIEDQRKALTTSVQEMPLIVETLDQEAKSTENDSLRMLILARRDAAADCVVRLKALDEQLAEQAREAETAIAPVREVADKFARLSRITESLQRIQEAHGLLETGEEAVQENQLELQLLYAVSHAAMARLRDIEATVDATQEARRELAEATRTTP